MSIIKEIKANPVFTFWVENKVANERKYFASDIRQVFQKWLLKQKIEWLEYYDSCMVVQSFITNKDGLNSTFENSQLDELVRLLKPDYDNIKTLITPPRYPKSINSQTPITHATTNQTTTEEI